jgi:hypothetical protein
VVHGGSGGSRRATAAQWWRGARQASGSREGWLATRPWRAQLVAREASMVRREGLAREASRPSSPALCSRLTGGETEEGLPTAGVCTRAAAEQLRRRMRERGRAVEEEKEERAAAARGSRLGRRRGWAAGERKRERWLPCGTGAIWRTETDARLPPARRCPKFRSRMCWEWTVCLDGSVRWRLFFGSVCPRGLIRTCADKTEPV